MNRLAMLLALVFAPLALAQTPDHRGEVTTPDASYQGVYASAPVPTKYHFKNEGGSDGAGLCVICSVVFNGGTQGVGDLAQGKESALWRAAKAREGGYHPGRLRDLVEEVMPGELYANLEGTDPSVLDGITSKGIPVGVTMNTGALYGYQPIHHMVSLNHHETGGYACVVDNNDPGKYHWMPTSEFDQRWIDGDVGWAFWWLKQPGTYAAPLLLVATAVLILGSSGGRRKAA